jgi:hypothetical protein
VIGEPQFMKIKEKHPLDLPCESSTNVKHKCYLSSNDVLNSAENNNESDAEVNGNNSIRCDKCNETPCEWIKYGAAIIKHINDEYFGRSVDEAGNVIDCCDSGDTIGNKQLRFLSYSEYTYMKHGYLGKHNRVPIPNCVLLCSV